MVAGVALSDVLNQGTVVGEEVAGQVDCFRVPDLAVLERVGLRLLQTQEAQFCSDTEVGHHDVQGFVKQLIFACHLVHKGGEAVWGTKSLRSMTELIKAHGLEVHDVADVEDSNPIITFSGLDPEGGARSYFEFALCQQARQLLEGLETNFHSLFLSHSVSIQILSLVEGHLRYRQKLLLNF